MKTIPTTLTIENGCELWGDVNGRHVRVATLQQWPQLDNRRLAKLLAAAPDLLTATERLLDEESPATRAERTKSILAWRSSDVFATLNKTR